MSRIYGLRFKFLTTTIQFNYTIKSVAFSLCEASVNADALCCCMTIKGHKTGDFHITLVFSVKCQHPPSKQSFFSCIATLIFFFFLSKTETKSGILRSVLKAECFSYSFDIKHLIRNEDIG